MDCGSLVVRSPRHGNNHVLLFLFVGDVRKLIDDLNYCAEHGKLARKKVLFNFISDAVRSVRLDGRGHIYHESTHRVFEMLKHYGGPRSHRFVRANLAGMHLRTTEKRCVLCGIGTPPPRERVATAAAPNPPPRASLCAPRSARRVPRTGIKPLALARALARSPALALALARLRRSLSRALALSLSVVDGFGKRRSGTSCLIMTSQPCLLFLCCPP